MKNIFLEKPYTKRGGEVSPRTFYKKLKFSIPLDQQPEMLQSLFLLFVHVEVYRNTLKLRCSLLTFTVYTSFWKKKRSGTSFRLILYMIFEGNISHVIFY